MPEIPALTQEIGRTGAALRGVCGDGHRLYAAVATAKGTTVSVVAAQAGQGAAQGWQPDAAWHAELPGGGGPIACTGALVLVTSSARMRGEPGSLVVALDAATGAERWRASFDATEWALIAAIAPLADGGAVIGGSFGGTLRSGTQLVSSAGRADGFVARLGPDGQVAWLVRAGGAGADAVQGVAAAAGRIAIAGTFAAGAELGGHVLAPVDPRSPAADAFVAELDPATGGRRWSATYGGPGDDAVAGVAIDGAGRIVVAGTAPGPVHAGGADLTPRGAADGLVAWFQPTGEPGTAILVGGEDFDGLSGIAAAGERVVIAGFFSGTIPLGGRALTAGGGDDSYLAALDAGGAVTDAWQVGGEGREEIAALAAVPGGFVAGVTHSARAQIDGAPATLPAPADPASGAALVVRAVR